MVTVENVTKVFQIPHERTKTLYHKLTNLFHSSYSYEKFFALQDVSFNVKKNEFLGIIGRNGSGKTTLLRIIAGIYQPTSGNIFVKEEITPFLEIGVGFQGDFTVRENIYINGALLGFSRKEIEKRFNNIIEFAELENFKDIKLNKLSAGMQVRLAFTIAIQSHAPILIVDEVMAVGDTIFQKKCRELFWEYKKQGRTVIFVSHDLGSVKEYCDRVIVLHKGQVVKDGNTEDIIKYYKEQILLQ
ncbi:MAG: ABC transporter ATP-binding protein [Bacteroidota bacterium]|nr:ABC transporter ATP-binding protein [Bacteroidota bacterium]